MILLSKKNPPKPNKKTTQAWHEIPEIITSVEKDDSLVSETCSDCE